MLDSGTVYPGQSAWCNGMVLVWKKDRSLCFCIDFCHLNAHMKKDIYPFPRIQEALKSLVSAGHFSCLDLKSGFWQIKMDKLSEQYTTFTVGNLDFFECSHMPFGLCKHASHVSEVNAKLPQGAESNILPWGAEFNILPHLP